MKLARTLVVRAQAWDSIVFVMCLGSQKLWESSLTRVWPRCTMSPLCLYFLTEAVDGSLISPDTDKTECIRTL